MKKKKKSEKYSYNSSSLPVKVKKLNSTQLSFPFKYQTSIPYH